MENEAITEEAFTVEITQYCDVNKLEIVQESLNMGQIAPGGDKEGNSRLFSQPEPEQWLAGQWLVVLVSHRARPSYLSKSVLKYQLRFVPPLDNQI